ncbi:MAG TPA: hypothetical protein P5211_00740 [Anaerolineae bacterium]|nr:hypothetical protein [Anaerolineae bacterium]HRT30923.1 hypothetical protein [Anaerolineae bacterium]HXK42014.1 hypothetical protein [Anaerolineae bacterium]
MPKRFLTERDINQFAAQGVKELVLEPGTVVTDLGKERARAAGIKLVQEICGAHPAAAPSAPAPGDDAQAAVRAAVIARLGGAPEGLDAIIARIFGEMKL